MGLPEDLKHFNAADYGGDSFQIFDGDDCVAILLVLFFFAALCV